MKVECVNSRNKDDDSLNPYLIFDYYNFVWKKSRIEGIKQDAYYESMKLQTREY